MMFRLVIVVAFIACTFAFMSRNMIVRKSEMKMSLNDIQSKIGRAVGIAAMGFALAGPMMPMENANADGAVSKSNVFRSRNSYGRRIKDLAAAAEKGDFETFALKKSINAFDLFISGSNAIKSPTSKALAAAEKVVENKIYAAVKAKDAKALKAAYAEFITVADLTSDYKEGELGQTDSSGYSPTWGTPSQYIYQR